MSSMNYVEAVLSRVLGREAKEGEVYLLEPDLMILYDWPAISDWFTNMIDQDLKLKQLPRPERMLFFLDHLLPVTTPAQEEFHETTRQWCEKFGIRYLEDKGIGHSVVVEDGIVKPGMLVAHFDTHVSTIGAVGALGFGIMLEMLMPMVTGQIWLKVPPVIQVRLEGEFELGVSGRDLLHRLVQDFGPGWAINHVVEFSGPGAVNVSVEGRMAICDLTNFFGAMTSYFIPDETTKEYLRENAGVEYESIPYDCDSNYSKTVSYNLADIEPTLIAPPSIEHAIPISDVINLPINLGIIGTCAAGRIEDIRIAADILKGHKIKKGFKLFVIPSSTKVFLEAMKRGYIDTLVRAGVFISSPTCDYCYGKGVSLGVGQKAISTQTLNVPGRLGCMDAEIYLASSAVVAATALTGEITDPRSLLKGGSQL